MRNQLDAPVERAPQSVEIPGDAPAPASARIRETREELAFGGGKTLWERVRDLKDGETVPDGAEVVASDADNHGWKIARQPGEG